MIIRCSLLLLAACALSGCANENAVSLAGFSPAAQAAVSNDQDLSRKTLGSKMLTAMALERVTGRKPDPARLAELN